VQVIGRIRRKLLERPDRWRKEMEGLGNCLAASEAEYFHHELEFSRGSLKSYDCVLFEVLAGRFIFASAFNLSAQR
jgi:hypothetical protein